MIYTPNKNYLSNDVGATFLGKLEVTPNNAAIKDVAVAQNREPQKIGARP
jgi:hypothetical protein